MQRFFINHRNPVMLVFTGKLSLSTLRWVPCARVSVISQVFGINLYWPNSPPASSSSLMIRSSFIGAVVLHIIHYKYISISTTNSRSLLWETNDVNTLTRDFLPRLFASRRHLVVDYYTYIYQLQLHIKYNEPSSSHLPRTSCCDCS